MRFLREVAGAQTAAEVKTVRRSGVTVYADGVEIVHVAQRDMYRKYRWPAKGALQAAIRSHIISVGGTPMPAVAGGGGGGGGAR